MNTKTLLALAFASTAILQEKSHDSPVAAAIPQEKSHDSPPVIAKQAPQGSAAAAANEAPRSLDATLDGIRSTTGIPGLAAAAVRDGKIVAVGVSGVRELGKPEPIARGDRFLVGSCTKAMTRLLYG